jgi:hypothetical protein
MIRVSSRLAPKSRHGFTKTTTTNVNDIGLQLNNWSTETKQIFIMRHKWWNYDTA